MSFETSLQEKLGEHKPDEIQELILDTVFKFDKFTEEHKTVLEKYKALIHLSLNGVGLTSLQNFPLLKELQIVRYIFYNNIYNKIQLELNKNKIKGEDLNVLSTQCPNLYKLKIEENEIDSADKFKCLTSLGLKKINLVGNPLVKNNENYQNLFFDMFKSLESVDDKDKEGKEVESTVYGGEEDDDGEDFEEGEDAGEDDDGAEGDDGEGDEVDDEEEEKEGNTQEPKADAKKAGNKKKKN